MQRCDLLKTKVVNTTQEFNEIAHYSYLEIQHIVLIGDKLLVSYRDFETENTPYALSNVVIAAFISSWARVHLYEA